ncbi:cytoskeletal protein RodZ [Kibdelosporangium banguiense]|uniref:Cytoskeletal protein RodZ n=1 Tax=Kibdelosporangium banguiense TaxID=1365924 RepID=A0ABS4T858_9PSEU|nr:hypothetical protein [Kibdelosporangium banguiense]MBP2320614.1 cytoskeletal protein RodZ [Kibdelosporangium banguiense]
MPIRTNRGRAAVYRRLWGWPLRSPRHLAAVAVFILAIVLFLSYILPRVTGGSQSPQNTAAGSTTSTKATGASAVPSQGAPGIVPPATQSPAGSSPQQSQTPTQTRQSPSENKTPARADPKAVDAALKWAEAFVNHPDGVSAQDWLNSMRDLTTEEYFATRLSTIDPKTVQAKAIRGGPRATAESYTSSVTVEVPTDFKKLSITVIKTGDGWRVNEHTEVD